MSVDVIAAVRKHSRTMLAARLTMFALADNAWSDGIAFPSQDELAESTLLDESTLRRGLRKAEALGELETRKARKGRSFFNVYRVTVGPIRLVDVDYGRLEKMGIRVSDPFTEWQQITAAALDSTGQIARLNAGLQPGKNDEFNRANRLVQPGILPLSNRNRKEPEEEPSAAAAEDLHDLADRMLDETLRSELELLGGGAKLRRLAGADPTRALAWVQIAKTDAVRNPAGFVLAGLESGEWPSVRGSLPGPTAFDRCRAWIDQTGCRFDPEDAHAHVDEWDDLGEVERQELHQLLDEAIAARHTPAAEAAA